MPATLPQETGDHDPELRWRAQDKDRKSRKLMDGEVIRELTLALSATKLYFFIIKT